MIHRILFVTMLLFFQQGWTQSNTFILGQKLDSVKWIHVKTDSGIIHAAVAVPEGNGPFPAIIILHGTHGFAEEYVELARKLAAHGFVSIAACWFTGRRGAGEGFITPIECIDAPPLVDVAGSDRFRIARYTIDSLVRRVTELPYVQKKQLALLGHSRGAGASLDYVFTNPGKVQAVILNSAGYPPQTIKRASEVGVPVLVLHGTDDKPEEGGSIYTNITMAYQFVAALRTADKDVQVKYYKGSGHNTLFTDAAQLNDTVRQVADFLHKKFSK